MRNTNVQNLLEDLFFIDENDLKFRQVVTSFFKSSLVGRGDASIRWSSEFVSSDLTLTETSASRNRRDCGKFNHFCKSWFFIIACRHFKSAGKNVILKSNKNYSKFGMCI